MTLDKVVMNVVLKNHEIARLREEFAQANPQKRQKI
jgi:hypothetical protein